ASSAGNVIEEYCFYEMISKETARPQFGAPIFGAFSLPPTFRNNRGMQRLYQKAGFRVRLDY
ncbi:MAG: hypothetical protein M1510_12860, partial [Nitrospirae bacterium]|nr:hypothetical protein [Nitrospirota bacterium]